MKTLKVSDEVYRMLMDLKIVLEAKTGHPVSFDRVIRHMINATMTHPNIEYRSVILGEDFEIKRLRRDGYRSRPRRGF